MKSTTAGLCLAIDFAGDFEPYPLSGAGRRRYVGDKRRPQLQLLLQGRCCDHYPY